MLIVDTAAGIGESVLQFSQAAQQVLVVLCDEPASLTDAYALVKVLSRDHGVRRFRVLANHDPPRRRRVQSCFGACSGSPRAFSRWCSILSARFPRTTTLRSSVRAQRPVLEAYPASPGRAGIQETGAHVPIRWPMPGGPRGRIEFFVERLLRTPGGAAEGAQMNAARAPMPARQPAAGHGRAGARTRSWSSASPIIWPGVCRRRSRSRT